MSTHIKYDIPEEWAKYYRLMRLAILKQVEIVKRFYNKNEISVLDVGCGRGELLADLQRIQAIPQGIDIDENCVRLSEKFGAVKEGDILSIPERYPKEYFNLVIAYY